MTSKIDSVEHIVYKITNKINQKYYIGIHTRKENVDDDYMGSGVYITNAINKYGVSNFEFVIIAAFNTREEAALFESIAVDITDPQTYNLVPGGGDPPNHKDKFIYTDGVREKRFSKDESIPFGWYRGRSEDMITKFKLSLQNFISEISPEERKEIYGNTKNMKRSFNPITGVQTISDIVPEGNTRGILKNSPNIPCFNPETEERMRVYKQDDIPSGWVRGNNWNNEGSKGLLCFSNNDGIQKFFKSEQDAIENGYTKRGNLAAQKALTGKIVVFNPYTRETTYVSDIKEVPNNWFRGRISGESTFCYKNDDSEKFYSINFSDEMWLSINRDEWTLGIPETIVKTCGKFIYNTTDKFLTKQPMSPTSKNPPLEGFIFVKKKDIKNMVCVIPS